MNTPLHHLNSENGQTMAEYGVVLALIVLAAAGAITVLNSAVLSLFGRVAALVPR